jgi:hypothetical protein
MKRDETIGVAKIPPVLDKLNLIIIRVNSRRQIIN